MGLFEIYQGFQNCHCFFSRVSGYRSLGIFRWQKVDKFLKSWKLITKIKKCKKKILRPVSCWAGFKDSKTIFDFFLAWIGWLLIYINFNVGPLKITFLTKTSGSVPLNILGLSSVLTVVGVWRCPICSVVYPGFQVLRATCNCAIMSSQIVSTGYCFTTCF